MAELDLSHGRHRLPSSHSVTTTISSRGLSSMQTYTSDGIFTSRTSVAPRSPGLAAPRGQRAADPGGDLGARVQRAAHALQVALGRVVGDAYEGHRSRSSPITGDSGRVGHVADRQQHARHEARAVGRHVADRERLRDVAEDDLLVGDDPRQPDRVDRHLATHHLGRARRGARRRVELGGVVQLDDLGALHVLGRLGGEGHHQHRADREVGGEERVRLANRAPPRAARPGRTPRCR